MIQTLGMGPGYLDAPMTTHREVFAASRPLTKKRLRPNQLPQYRLASPLRALVIQIPFRLNVPRSY